MEQIQVSGPIDIEIEDGLVIELHNDGKPIDLMDVKEGTKIRIGIDYTLLVHTILSLLEWDEEGKASEEKIVKNLFYLPSTIEARCKEGFHPCGKSGMAWKDKLLEWKNKLLNW